MAAPHSFFRWWSCFTLPGFLHWLTLRIRGKTIMVAGSCSRCGRCCQSISLEGPFGWLRSERTFKKMVISSPEYRRFVIIGKDALGYLLFRCTCLAEDGSCGDYDKRPALCRHFPESSLVFACGQLPPACGYRFVEGIPFKKFLNAAVRRQK